MAAHPRYLQGTDVGVPYQPQQVPWRLASCIRGDLATDVGEVRASSDRRGGQRGLRYGETLWGVRGQDLGRYSCGAAPVAAARP